MIKGKLPDDVLNALLETLPVEFSIVDADDKVLAWNRHDSRVFRRAESVLGRDVRACHPGKSLAKVEAIIAEMKKGTRESAEFWIDMKLEGATEPEKILIQYFALRSETGEYLGCLECSQKIGRIQGMKGQKRLAD
jgi:DUF438 domain-containing protein